MLTAFGGGKVFGEKVGDGPVRVLLMHGWRRTSSDFVELSRALASRGLANVALDLPGFGSSPPLAVPGGAREYVAALADVVGGLAEEPLVVLGHSFGGRVAIVLAAQRPELVAGLVLTGVPLVRLAPPARPDAAYRAVRRLARMGLVPDRVLERARERHGSDDYRAARGVMRETLVATVAESYEDELARWRGPTRLVWGAGDREAPVAVAERARSLLGGPSELVVLEGVGHLTPLEAPLALLEAVAELVR